ncbi:hypothetical protein CDL15_Pgr000664 [Punica granatum]|uniref:Transmembrane protein n=1 Tax=Punica granatum TaxID=22663 RepID=A0A218W530_PUNGR|nr:hypothetical protein CDL15_Pgr000664 [Punica granatum]PKI47792.1 hypothetical protein CRG98_031821 [Punica granatum]
MAHVSIVLKAAVLVLTAAIFFMAVVVMAQDGVTAPAPPPKDGTGSSFPFPIPFPETPPPEPGAAGYSLPGSGLVVGSSIASSVLAVAVLTGYY